jgi:hypothetical protein
MMVRSSMVQSSMVRHWDDGLVCFGRLRYEYGAATEEVRIDGGVVPIAHSGRSRLANFFGYPVLHFWLRCEKCHTECERVGCRVMSCKVCKSQLLSVVSPATTY